MAAEYRDFPENRKKSGAQTRGLCTAEIQTALSGESTVDSYQRDLMVSHPPCSTLYCTHLPPCRETAHRRSPLLLSQT